jgi:hypothetical protein
VDDAARTAPNDDAVLDARARLARDRKDWSELAQILIARAEAPGGAAVAANARALAALALRIAVGSPEEAAIRLAEVPETEGSPWTLTRAATELAAGRGLAAAERLGAAAASARTSAWRIFSSTPFFAHHSAAKRSSRSASAPRSPWLICAATI